MAADALLRNGSDIDVHAWVDLGRGLTALSVVGVRFESGDNGHHPRTLDRKDADMAIADRSVTTTWEGDLASGTGTFHDTSSGTLDDQQVTWASRTEAPSGKSSPEELAAAAHSACFSMALSGELGKNKTPPTRLDVACVVTLDEVDGAPTVTTSAITVRATVDGIDDETFQQVAANTGQACPISRLFAGAKITVDATLSR